MNERTTRHARWVGQHLPVLLALGAVGLYVLGVVGTAGQLRASHVDLGAGMGVIPVERHLRSGIGVVVKPSTLLYVLAYGIYWWLLSRDQERQRRSPENQRPRSEGYSRTETVAGLSTLALVLLAAPWAIGVWALVFVAVIFGMVLVGRSKGGVSANLYMGTVIAFLLFTSVVDTYLRADPLPTARVSTASGTVSGPLVAVDDGTVYLAGQGKPNDLFTAVGGGTIRTVQVTRERRAPESSVLDFLGIDPRPEKKGE